MMLLPAFLSASPVALRHSPAPRSAAASTNPRHGVYMAKGKKRPPNAGKSASSNLSREQQQRLQKIAEGFGVQPPRAGDLLDEKFTSTESRAADARQREAEKAPYLGLVRLVGQRNLESIEMGTYVLLAILLFTFLSTGLAIASEAFYKSLQSDVPPALSSFVDTFEGSFTPLLFLFIGISSALGLYKQAQLNAGAAQYDETKQK